MGAPINPLVALQSESAPKKPFIWASPVAQTAKNLPAMRETQVRSLGWEALEKGMATHSSTFAWRIPWTEEPGRLQSMGLQRVRHDRGTNMFIFTSPFHSNRLACVLPEFKCSSSTSSGSPSDPFGLWWFMLFETQSYFYCFIWHLFSLWWFIYFYPYCLILNCVLVLVFLSLCKSSSPTRLQCCWV